MAAGEAGFPVTSNAWRAGVLSGGRKAFGQLVRRIDVPKAARLRTRSKATFCRQSLADLTPSFAARPLVFPVLSGWSRFNPTLAQGPGGLTAVVRAGNYAIDDAGQYTVIDRDGVVRSQNSLLQLTPDGSVVTANLINVDAVRADPPVFPVTGFEDCRLIWQNGAWWLAATRRDASPDGICQMVLLRLHGDRVIDLIPLSDGVSEHEKNWMPVVIEEPGSAMYFVYSIAPTVVMKLDPATREVTRVVRRRAPSHARRLRGGGQVLSVAEGWLAIAHDAVTFDDDARIYSHR